MANASERAAKWNREHPEQRRAIRRRWYLKNRKRMAFLTKRWGKANPERRRAMWTRSNEKRKKAGYFQRYFRQTREQHAEHFRRYYARKIGNGGRGITLNEWRALKAIFRGRCVYCGRRGKLTQDHVVPLSRGGKHELGNVLPCCLRCNQSKNGAFLKDWLVRYV